MIEKPLRNYLLVALLVAGVLFGGRAGWQETVKFGCLPVNGTPPAGSWMDGCASDQIGSYDHDVLWFDIDPQAVAGVQRAQVMLFGDSRMLSAMSLGIGSAWFAARHIPMYLAAFAANEQSGWVQRLMEKLHAHPRLAVFDADPFFTGEESVVAQAITSDPAGEEAAARATKAFLDRAPLYCGILPWLCGRTERSYRQYLDGAVVHQDRERVWFNRNEAGSFPIATPGPQQTAEYDRYLANAQAMLTVLGVEPRCAVFTIVPNSEMDDTLARFLADRLGARVVAPRLEGLSTSDHFHLTADSSRVWTEAFLRDLKPIVQECAGDGERTAFRP
jgi:hypothetical protein